jgi:Arc/MetJ family transcription regulator
MTTHLAIDNRLLETAFHLGGLKTPKETVNLALEEFIKSRKMEELIGMFHSVDYDSDYNYKKLRNRQ